MTVLQRTRDDEPVVATTAGQARTRLGVGRLAVAGLASLGAGAVHATAVGAHSEHRQAAWAFAGLAIVQLAWGAGALVRSAGRVATVGLLVNLGAVVGWVVAKTSGIPVIDGLDQSEPIQWADALAAGLAAASVVAVVVALARGSARSARSAGPGRLLLSGTAAVVAVATVGGMVTAGTHEHAGTDGHAHGSDEAAATEPEHGRGAEHAAAAVAPVPYDPAKPIDLGGVEGVTPAQQAAAENLIAITLDRLPRLADPAAAETAGFRSIGDSFTGFEHYINIGYIVDDEFLNPDVPESIVYEVDPATGDRTLVSAMFMAPLGMSLEAVPDIGGPLMQWHVHDNLCFNPSGGLAGLTQPDGSCAAGSVKAPEIPMIHVWIVPHACGPFAALEGEGAGQIAEGETRLCDHAHGA